MRRKVIDRVIVFSLLIAVVLLFGAHNATTQAQGKNPLERVRIGLSASIGNLDPAASQGAPTYQPAVLIGGQLFRYDDKHEPQPDLVESYEVSTDGLTYTMKLRQNVKYSDGTPLTIEDVVAMWDHIKGAAGTNKTLIQNVTALETPDKQTLVWKLSAPEPDFIQFFGLHFMMIHPKDRIKDPEYWKKPVSAGPYMFKEWTPGAPNAVLVENPNYIHGPMAIKQIETVAVPDLTNRTLQLAQGNLDYVFDLPPTIRGTISKQVTTYPHPIAGMYHVCFNMSLPNDHPLRNRDVREAISLAIDREAISRRAFNGISAPAKSFLYPGVPEYYENLPNGGQRDLEAAKKLLATTPFKDGFKFRLGVWGQRPGWRDATQVIKENLADLNITAEIESMEDAVAIDQLNKGTYEAQFSGNATFPAPGFLGNLFRKGAWATWTRYENPEMLKLFDEAGTLADRDKRVEVYKKIQDLAYKDLPVIPISERVVLSGTRVAPNLVRAVAPGEYIWVSTLKEMR